MTLQNAHRFHHHGDPRVVGGTVPARPGIEMGAEHDHLGGLVVSRNLGNHVEGIHSAFVSVFLIRIRASPECSVQDPHDPVVLLDRHDDLRHRGRILRVA